MIQAESAVTCTTRAYRLDKVEFITVQIRSWRKISHGMKMSLYDKLNIVPNNLNGFFAEIAIRAQMLTLLETVWSKTDKLTNSLFVLL